MPPEHYRSTLINKVRIGISPTVLEATWHMFLDVLKLKQLLPSNGTPHRLPEGVLKCLQNRQ